MIPHRHYDIAVVNMRSIDMLSKKRLIQTQAILKKD